MRAEERYVQMFIQLFSLRKTDTTSYSANNLRASSQWLMAEEPIALRISRLFMAEITTNIDREIDLTTHVVIGELTSRGILNTLDDYYQQVPTQKILWDLTLATWANMNERELRSTVVQAKKYSRKGGKTALVFCSDLDFGLGRMLATFADIEGFDFEFACFRDIDDANDWLFSDADE